jgi:hypothetical protein
VTITGDGTGATATAVRDAGTNTITRVDITSGGSGYTYATVTFSGGGGANASATAIISPKGGHGSDAIKELGGFYVMMNVRLEYNDGSGDFPVDNDYRRITLIRDPYNFGSTTVATLSTRTASKSIAYSSLSGTLLNDRIIIGGTSGAKGRITSIDTTNTTIRYIQTSTDNPTGVAFQSSETVTMYATDGTTPTAVTFTSGSLTNPEIQPDSGDVIYVENRRPINRAIDQIEDIKIIVEM